MGVTSDDAEYFFKNQKGFHFKVVGILNLVSCHFMGSIELAWESGIL